jgi:exopolysaccharide biosynthesis polyprenyl glycosylphosphotransferase
MASTSTTQRNLRIAGTAAGKPESRPYSTTPFETDHEPRSNRTGPAGKPLSRVLIVGVDTVARQLAQSLEARGKHMVVGFVGDASDNQVDGTEMSSCPILGRRNATAKIVHEYAIDEVFIAHAPTWQQQLAEQMTAECPMVNLHVVPTSYEAMLNVGRTRSCGDIAVVTLNERASRSTQMIRRVFDVMVAILVLGLLAPVWGVIALLIKMTSPGAAIFAQDRVGLNGQIFKVLKFRTMRQDAEVATGPVLSTGKQDARLTGLGRYLRLFRIDEVPQFWNVLRGEMSLVGPRPERPVFVEKYCAQMPTYARRHDVRPGITGLAQVYGGYHTDGCDKLRFDLAYASHQSLWFDLEILLRTVLVIVMPDDKH